VAALTFLSVSLSRRPALVLAVFVTALSLTSCLLLIWYGWKFADLAGSSRIPAMRFILGDIFGPEAPKAPTIFWVYVALPFGMGLLALRLIADIFLCSRALRRGETLGDALDRRKGVTTV
jgi:TRAP-type C4-dicarboxylate transport system permease small subunit